MLKMEELTVEMEFDWRDEFGYAEFHLMQAIDAIRGTNPRARPFERQQMAVSNVQKALAFLNNAQMN